MNRHKKAFPFILAALLFTLALAAFVSPLASSSPDGLEKVAAEQGFSHQGETHAVWRHSPAPDYGIPGLRNKKVATGLACLLGTGLVFVLGHAAAKGLARRGRTGMKRNADES
jgi:cobalt/nickel transport protein